MMKSSLVTRARATPLALALLVLLAAGVHAQSTPDPLPSWNDGSAKQAIVKFVTATTTAGNPAFVAPGARFATFDQDGTLWVEQPMYVQLDFALDRVHALAPEHPAWKTTEPFKSVLSGDRAAMAKFTMKDLEQILLATHTGMTTGQFTAIVKAWLATASNPRWHRPYTDMVYQPMLQVMRYLRANGYRTYIVTGGGQAFVRTYAEQTYGVPPEQVIGSALETEFTYNAAAEAILMRPPKLLINNDFSGKAEDIYLFIGGPPQAAFGNSAGDRQMLEYTQSSGKGALMMLVLHDDAAREYAYGPADGLPASKIGAFPQALYDEAKAKGWNVISMKHDWKRIFSFHQ
jgi:phosphoserine phosphatase